MCVQISFSSNHFVSRKNPSLQLFQNFFCFHLPLVSFIVGMSSWKKSHSKNCFLEENKTSFISSWFLLHLFLSKNSFLLFNCPFIFLRLLCFLFSLFFCSVFSISRNMKDFSNIFFWTFFGGGNIFWSKKKKSVIINSNFLQKKNLPLLNSIVYSRHARHVSTWLIVPASYDEYTALVKSGNVASKHVWRAISGTYRWWNLDTVTYWVMWRFFWLCGLSFVVFPSARVNWCTCASVVICSNSVVIVV